MYSDLRGRPFDRARGRTTVKSRTDELMRPLRGDECVVIVDTNAVVDVLEDGPDWVEWSTDRMRDLPKIHEFAINPAIEPGLSLTFEDVEELDAVVSETNLKFMSSSKPPRPIRFRPDLQIRCVRKYRNAPCRYPSSGLPSPSYPDSGAWPSLPFGESAMPWRPRLWNATTRVNSCSTNCFHP